LQYLTCNLQSKWSWVPNVGLLHKKDTFTLKRVKCPKIERLK
jgi:hypothetical protein